MNRSVLLVFAFLLTATFALAAESWKVSDAGSGESAIVSRIAGDNPQVGETVSISFEIPGLGEKAVRAKGTIAQVGRDSFTVRIDPASRSGKIAVGDVVERIGKPKSMPAATTAPSSTPPASPTQESPAAAIEDKPLSELIPPRRQEFVPRTEAQLLATRDAGGGVDFGKAAARVLTLFEENFVRETRIDDLFSRRLLRTYLDWLDPSHLYFVQADINRFTRQYETTLDDDLKKDDISAAFAIFSAYEERVAQTRRIAARILWEERFTFSGDEWIELNRTALPWPKDEIEQAGQWKRQIRSRLLQLILAKDELPTTDELAKMKLAVLEEYSRYFETVQRRGYDDVAGYFLKNVASSFSSDSDYYTPAEIQASQTAQRGAFTGIGAVLKINPAGYAQVDRLIAGGPAQRHGGIHAGDQILAVAQGEDGEWFGTASRELSDIVEQIRGKAGAKVRLQLLDSRETDESAKRVITIERGKVEIAANRPHAEIIDWPRPGEELRVGWITLPIILGDGSDQSLSSSADVRKLLQRLREQGAEGIALDLRRNTGGQLGESMSVAGLFLEKGPLCLSKMRRGEPQSFSANDDADPLWDGPLVVVTGPNTAGGAEMIAGAIQDQSRGPVVGAKSTFGRSAGARFFPVAEDGSAAAGYARISIEAYYRLTGQPYQLRAVVPDVVLPHQQDELKIGERHAANPLKLDPVAAAPIKPFANAPNLGTLRARSQSRLLESPAFRQIAGQNRQNREILAANRLSLNLEARLREKEQRREREQAKSAISGKTEPISAKSRFTLAGGEISESQPTEPPAPDPAKREALAILADVCGAAN